VGKTNERRRKEKAYGQAALKRWKGAKIVVGGQNCDCAVKRGGANNKGAERRRGEREVLRSPGAHPGREKWKLEVGKTSKASTTAQKTVASHSNLTKAKKVV